LSLSFYRFCFVQLILRALVRKGWTIVGLSIIESPLSLHSYSKRLLFQVRYKALCLIEASIRQREENKVLDSVTLMFEEDASAIVDSLQWPQASLREKAKKVNQNKFGWKLYAVSTFLPYFSPLGLAQNLCFVISRSHNMLAFTPLNDGCPRPTGNGYARRYG
jgi:hypothetical protein